MLTTVVGDGDGETERGRRLTQEISRDGEHQDYNMRPQPDHGEHIFMVRRRFGMSLLYPSVEIYYIPAV